MPDYFYSTPTPMFRDPVAYIEWMTPFRSKDAATDMFTLSRSTRMHQPHGEVVAIDRIVRNCHLIPAFGNVTPSGWRADNVGILCEHFYLSPYSDLHIFCMLKLRRSKCY